MTSPAEDELERLLDGYDCGYSPHLKQAVAAVTAWHQRKLEAEVAKARDQGYEDAVNDCGCPDCKEYLGDIRSKEANHE